MRKLLTIFGLLSLISASLIEGSFAQQRRTRTSPASPAPSRRITTISATTDDGRRVILKSDGTWEFAPLPPKTEEVDTPERAELRKLIKPIKEVETDQLGFVGKQFVFNGVIEPGSFYNYGYMYSQETHYAYEMHDSSGTAYLYIRRDSPAAAGLRQQLLNAQGNKLRAACLVTILRSRIQANQMSIFAELLGCDAPF